MQIPISKYFEKDKESTNSAAEATEIERTFWKNLKFQPPLYGADLKGSLSENIKSSWNMNNLASILNCLQKTMPGINQPYLYFGMWKAMFAWHCEDMNLLSINYLHFGEPKHWYAIPSQSGPRFERFAQSLFPNEFKKCPQHLRHKTTLISPYIIAKNHQIPVYKVIQTEGDFVITAPAAYHCGFNFGFNCAESVNFATEGWISYGKKADFCNCAGNTARINMNYFMEQYQASKRKKKRQQLQPKDLSESILINVDGTVTVRKRKSEEDPNPQVPKKRFTVSNSIGNKNEMSTELLQTQFIQNYENMMNDSKMEVEEQKGELSANQISLLQQILSVCNNQMPSVMVRMKLADLFNSTPSSIFNWFYSNGAKQITFEQIQSQTQSTASANNSQQTNQDSQMFRIECKQCKTALQFKKPTQMKSEQQRIKVLCKLCKSITVCMITNQNQISVVESFPSANANQNTVAIKNEQLP